MRRRPAGDDRPREAPPITNRLPRRRRSSQVQRWLPTIIAVALITGGLLAAGLRVFMPGEASPATATGAGAVPEGTVAVTEAAANIASSPRIRFAVATIEPRHTITEGDTLFGIAQRYNTTVDGLVAMNNLPDRSATLRIGQRLVIP